MYDTGGLEMWSFNKLILGFTMFTSMKILSSLVIIISTQTIIQGKIVSLLWEIIISN